MKYDINSKALVLFVYYLILLRYNTWIKMLGVVVMCFQKNVTFKL